MHCIAASILSILSILSNRFYRTRRPVTWRRTGLAEDELDG